MAGAAKSAGQVAKEWRILEFRYVCYDWKYFPVDILAIVQWRCAVLMITSLVALCQSWVAHFDIPNGSNTGCGSCSARKQPIESNIGGTVPLHRQHCDITDWGVPVCLRGIWLLLQPVRYGPHPGSIPHMCSAAGRTASRTHATDVQYRDLNRVCADWQSLVLL
jgi:hypothetical protein